MWPRFDEMVLTVQNQVIVTSSFRARLFGAWICLGRGLQSGRFLIEFFLQCYLLSLLILLIYTDTPSRVCFFRLFFCQQCTPPPQPLYPFKPPTPPVLPSPHLHVVVVACRSLVVAPFSSFVFLVLQRVDLSTFGQTHQHDMNMNGGSDDERAGGPDQRVQCQNM